MDLRQELQINRKRARQQAEKIQQAEKRELTQKEYRKEKDKALFEAFKSITEGKRYFEIEDVDALGVKYDILFVLGKKNIGKTHQIYKLFSEIESHPKHRLIFGRVGIDECQLAATHLSIDEECPIFMQKKLGMMTLFSKKDNRDLGYMIPFKTSNKGMGGTFPNIKYVIFDEIIPYDPRKVINASILENWAAFASSVVRNKTGVKMFLFGNLRPSNNEVLNFYGISPTDKLRYINRGGCRILYINTGTLYEGISKQDGIAQHSQPKLKFLLENNAYVQNRDSVISSKHFDEMTPLFYLTHFMKSEKLDVLVETRVINYYNPDTDDWDTFWAVKMQPLEPHHSFSLPIYSDDHMVSNTYFGVEYKPDLVGLWTTLLLALKFNKLLFFDTNYTFVHIRTILGEMIERKRVEMSRSKLRI